MVGPLEMMEIPAGEFLMGSPKDEEGRFEWEGPQHKVTISQFYMGKSPVTQAQWRAVATLPQIEQRLQPDSSAFEGNDRPVDLVSWAAVTEFCKRLSKHTGRQYRLPSEAEWEYACRAGTTTPFSFGDTLIQKQANFGGTVGETTPVFKYPPNAFGLHDMHGNVWEWCEDVWHYSYEGAPTDGSAWIEGSDLLVRVMRGGSCDVTPWDCRSASRYRGDPDYGGYNIGFRVCCAASRTS